MNLLQPLYLIEQRFKALKPIQKVQLYLIPLCLMGIVLYSDVPLYAQIQQQNKPKLQTYQADGYHFIKAFEAQSKALNITLQSLQEQNNGFAFEINGGFRSLMQILLFCETYGSVNSVHDIRLKPLENEQYSLKVELVFATKKYLPKNKEHVLQSMSELHNPFIQKQATVHALKLYAIVNDEVLINHEWLHLNEQISEYKLIKINPQAVVLENQLGQHILLEL